MKHLTVIRHAKTGKQKQGQRDFDRALKKKGVAAAKELGGILVERSGEPDMVITSPANRAVQTTNLLCKAAGIDKKKITEMPLLYENDMPEIMNMLRGLSEEISRVFIVGHNPSVTDLVKELCGPVVDDMKTGSAAGIEIDIASWNDIAPGGASLGFYLTT